MRKNMFIAILIRPLVSSLLLLSLFAGLSLLVSRHQTAVFDQRTAAAVQSLRSDGATAVMKGFTAIGFGPWVAVISLLLLVILVFLGYRRELIFFVFVIAGSALLNVLLKLIFQRTRPDVNRIIDAAGYSFPSGHSMSAFTLYGITIYFLWKHLGRNWIRLIAVALSSLMILMIGVSRIYLGVHYPSDVVGGYLISAAWLVSCIGWYERYRKESWKSSRFRPSS